MTAKTKKILVAHPFLFAVYPILFLLSHNIAEINFLHVLAPLGIVLAITVVLMLLFRLFSLNLMKAGLLISVFWILFFSYGHVRDFINEWHLWGINIGKQRYILVVWGILFSLSVYGTIRIKNALANLTSILNITALSLLIMSFISIGLYRFKGNDAGRGSHLVTSVEGMSKPDNTKKKPDIYYIILDMYARQDVLKDIFNYDNSEFIDYLRHKGFYVASNSHSNYTMTQLSIASSLNMNYINDITTLEGVDSRNRRIPYSRIKDNLVMRLLKENGYKTITFASGWGPTDNMKGSDIHYRYSYLNELSDVLMKTTLLRVFIGKWMAFNQRFRLLHTFDDLPKIRSLSEPTFTFAHVFSPHMPFVFGRKGEASTSQNYNHNIVEWNNADKQSYIDQLVYTNKRIMAIIDGLLSDPQNQPVIILQSDHGPYSTIKEYKGYGWYNPTDSMYKERMSILNAYYLPGTADSVLYPSITPVNSFRIIFNRYFDARIKLLEDNIYFSVEPYPYKFGLINAKFD